MTTDVKLPEPVACRWRGSGRVHYLRWVYANAGSPSTPPSGAEPLYTADQVRAHAAKLLAENERLRAEAARLRRSLNEAITHGNRQSGRAERLAEALRLIAAPQRPDGTWNRDREACRQIAHAALDQEGGNG